MKKYFITLLGLFFILSLTACSKTVATTNGGKITESEYYSSLKTTSSGKAVLQQMILNKVLEQEYGKKVSDKQVDKRFNEYKSQYGDSFTSILQQSGYTSSSFKKSIRSTLLLTQAVKQNTKITNSMLEKQWKNYEPTITVAHILVSKKEEAQDIIKQLDSNATYDNFKKLAKDKSIDTSTAKNGGQLPPFNNTDTTLDSDFKKAAFSLKQGSYTKEPVKTSYGYHVIWSVKNPGKGKMSDHTSQLKDQIYQSKLADTTYMQGVIANVLKKGKVSIKDKDLKNVLDSYTAAASSSMKK